MLYNPLANNGRLARWFASQFSLFAHLSVTPSSATGSGVTLRPGALRVPSGSLLAKVKTAPFGTVFLWQGQKDLKLLYNPLANNGRLARWFASQFSLFAHLSVTPSSATGSGVTLRPGALRVPSGSLLAKVKTAPFGTVFLWQGQKDLNPRHAVLETAALPTELYP